MIRLSVFSRLFVVFLALAFFCGCSHSVHQVGISEFRPYQPENQGKTIRTETSQFSILGFNGDTDYVNNAYHQLANQCQGGQVSGISTQFITDHGFFSWTNRVIMQGLCLAQK